MTNLLLECSINNQDFHGEFILLLHDYKVETLVVNPNKEDAFGPNTPEDFPFKCNIGNVFSQLRKKPYNGRNICINIIPLLSTLVQTENGLIYKEGVLMVKQPFCPENRPIGDIYHLLGYTEQTGIPVLTGVDIYRIEPYEQLVRDEVVCCLVDDSFPTNEDLKELIQNPNQIDAFGPNNSDFTNGFTAYDDIKNICDSLKKLEEEPYDDDIAALIIPLSKGAHTNGRVYYIMVKQPFRPDGLETKLIQDIYHLLEVIEQSGKFILTNADVCRVDSYIPPVRNVDDTEYITEDEDDDPWGDDNISYCLQDRVLRKQSRFLLDLLRKSNKDSLAKTSATPDTLANIPVTDIPRPSWDNGTTSWYNSALI